MNRSVPALAALVAALLLAGCATPAPPARKTDPDEGTNFSPYRSIPPVLLCDDCRY